MMAIFSFLFSPIGKALGIFGLIIAALLGFRIWLAAHDTRVLEGYVALSEKTTADAKTAEAKRQADINAQSAEEYRRKLVIIQAQDAKDDAEHEARIKDYEKQLDDEKRKCSLTRADIGTIMHNGTGKAAPVVKRKGPH
jgi:hypothetical protein